MDLWLSPSNQQLKRMLAQALRYYFASYKYITSTKVVCLIRSVTIRNGMKCMKYVVLMLRPPSKVKCPPCYDYCNMSETSLLALLWMKESRPMICMVTYWHCTQKKIYVYTSDRVILVHAMKADGGVEILLHSLLTSALDRGKWSALCPQLFTSKERATQHPLNRMLSRLQR